MEFAPFTPDPQAAAAADVVVLAGDIDVGVKGVRWAARAFAGKPVIYVTGNHEFYGGHWHTTLAQMRAEAEALGVHFLENDSLEIDGVRFLGCSLWTNFEYFGRDRRHRAMLDVENGMNDFKLIKAEPLRDVYWKTKRHRITARHVLRRHEESLAWLIEELPKDDPWSTVVVVHHAPRAESIPEIYKGNPLTPGYASRLADDLMAAARLWVHGHVHDLFDYSVGRSRVVCNPRGYKLHGRGIENSKFNPGLLVTFDDERGR